MLIPIPHTKNEVPQRQRIEYLDALRGFTMILVVIHHVYNYVFGYSNEQIADSYNYYFSIFHMPLFFFVAGFVLYKKEFYWDLNNSISFLKKKINVSVLSPFLFWLVYVTVKDIDMCKSLLSVNKSGYWFTFALFEYFILYIVFQLLVGRIKIKDKLNDILMICYGFVVIISPYAFKALAGLDNGGLINSAFMLLGLENFRLFIFFVFGIIVRKRFHKFENLLDNSLLIIYCLVFFIAFNIIIPDINVFHKFIQIPFKLVLGVCGIIVTFSFFRKYLHCFCKERMLGKIMQFIGRRTLDIYLLHYFFLPTGLRDKLCVLGDYNMPLLDFSLASILAIVVIMACLFISCILRMHSNMANFLFGVKKAIKEE